MDTTHLKIFDTTEEVMEQLFEWWQEKTHEQASSLDSIQWALSGGKTPLGLYKKLAQCDQLPWNHLHLFLVDERDVDVTSPDSNYNLCLQSGLTDRLSKDRFPLMRQAPLEKGIEIYEKALQKAPLDLVLLGMGTDGHTASLFPGTKEAERTLDSNSWNQGPMVIAHELLHQPISSLTSKWRLTLTFKALILAKEVVFLITGAEKSHVLSQILKDPLCTLPTAKLWRLRESLGLTTYWFMDKAAAKEILA